MSIHGGTTVDYRMGNYPRNYAAPTIYYDEYGQEQVPREIAQQGDLFRWMYQHSVAIPHGLFGLITSTGPSGGPHLDDMPILDASDANQILLIVVVPSGDDFVAYRKLMHLPESGEIRH